MDDDTLFLRAVSEPVRLMGATPDLTKGAAAIAILTYFLTLNGLYAMIAFAIGQMLAAALTLRDPDISRTWRARAWTPRTRSFWGGAGNLYVP